MPLVILVVGVSAITAAIALCVIASRLRDLVSTGQDQARALARIEHAIQSGSKGRSTDDRNEQADQQVASWIAENR